MKNNNIKEILKLETKIINGEEKQFIDARNLHKFLKSKQEFANWIKNRIEEYGFLEQKDFLINLSKSNFGRPTKEYFLTISTAKELSMVERNEKGKQARQYFIKCEETLKKVLTRDVNYFLENPKEMRDLLLGYNQKVLTLQPKAQAYDLIATADKSDLCISTTAKELQLKPSELFKWLDKNYWIFKRLLNQNWLAYQDKINQGLLKLKLQEVWVNGELKLYPQVFITPKGLTKLAQVFLKEKVIN